MNKFKEDVKLHKGEILRLGEPTLANFLSRDAKGAIAKHVSNVMDSFASVGSTIFIKGIEKRLRRIGGNEEKRGLGEQLQEKIGVGRGTLSYLRQLRSGSKVPVIKQKIAVWFPGSGFNYSNLLDHWMACYGLAEKLELVEQNLSIAKVSQLNLALDRQVDFMSDDCAWWFEQTRSINDQQKLFYDQVLEITSRVIAPLTELLASKEGYEDFDVGVELKFENSPLKFHKLLYRNGPGLYAIRAYICSLQQEYLHSEKVT